MTEYECISLWLSGATALGTIGAVLYALYGSIMDRWFRNPKLELKIANAFPFCYYHKNDNGNDSDPVFENLEISAILVNSKEFNANHCQVLCKGIYVLEANKAKFTSYIKIRPSQFPWQNMDISRQNSVIDIEQSVDYYVKIAEISKPLNKMTSNGDKPVQNDKPSIKIAIPHPNGQGAGYIKIPYETVLVELQIVSSNSGPLTYGVRIDWRGDNISEFENKEIFTIALITGQELSTLISQEFKR